MRLPERLVRDLMKKFPNRSITIENKFRFSPKREDYDEDSLHMDYWILWIDDMCLEDFDNFTDLVNHVTRLTNEDYKPKVNRIEYNFDPYPKDLKDNYRGD